LLVLEKTAAEIAHLAVAQTLLVVVRKEGLEPTRLAALEPKSSASTNSATFAHPIPKRIGEFNRAILPDPAPSRYLANRILLQVKAIIAGLSITCDLS
jgi:hypothetical protein